MKVFEVIAKGFDGNSDETDDHVLWVCAKTEEEVKRAIADTGAMFWGEITGDFSDDDLDFVLPQNTLNLQEKLLQFASDYRNRSRA